VVKLLVVSHSSREEKGWGGSGGRLQRRYGERRRGPGRRAMWQRGGGGGGLHGMSKGGRAYDAWAGGHRTGAGQFDLIPIQIQMNSNIIHIDSNFDPSKKDLIELQKFEIKYGFEYIETMNNFLHINFFRFERDFELNFLKIKVCFDFRKLIKVARNGLKFQEFAWRYEIQFRTLFMFCQLISNLH
jgi:hypothetical protein